MSEAEGLLAELNLGSARGGKRRPGPLLVEVVRSLSEGDLPLLLAPPSVAAKRVQVAQLRHSHHQLAQLLARGTEQAEAALITGYAPATISRLVTQDRAFGELLVHYRIEREAVFVDVLERMKVLGLSTLDELQARLEDDAEGWSRRELMEMAELMLVKGRQQGSGAQGSAVPAVSVSVKFVTAERGGQAEASADAVDLAWKDVAE